MCHFVERCEVYVVDVVNVWGVWAVRYHATKPARDWGWLPESAESYEDTHQVKRTGIKFHIMAVAASFTTNI